MSHPAGSASGADEVLQVEPDGWLELHTGLLAEGWTFFDFLTAVDQTDDAQHPGFDVVCHLYDPAPGDLRAITVRTRIAEDRALPSLTGLWRGAAWHERETHEMFGVGFSGYDDGTGLGLRPLLLPDGFEGRPLRKDFVLAARVTRPWPGAKEPGESGDGGGRARRRKAVPPGVPDPAWGPR